jgi:predicted helicase
VFLEHAHEAINPNLTEADVREMLIQHILTDDIFSKVFAEDDFHHQNNVAKSPAALEDTFFTGDLKRTRRCAASRSTTRPSARRRRRSAATRRSRPS